MKSLVYILPFMLTACINVSTSVSATPKWDEASKGKWALSLIGIKKDINDCYYHLEEEEYDLFNVHCDAIALGARLNELIITYENQKAQYPDFSDSQFLIAEFGDDLDVAMTIAADLRALDHMKGFIVSFALADIIINH